jgi:uncharacterized membrane protein required for colicin V production
VLAAAAVFNIALMLLGVLTGILNAVASLPLVNIVNKLGGALLGVLQGVVIVWIIVTVIKILPLIPFMSRLYELIASSRIAVMFL